MKKFIIFCSVLSVVGLSACAGKTTVNKFNNETYLQASSVAELDVPTELANTTYIEPYYPAPAGTYPEKGEAPVSSLPPGLGDLLEKSDDKPKKDV